MSNPLSKNGFERQGRSYHIIVKSITNTILHFKGIKSYSIDEGLITFIDSKTGLERRFPVDSIEIAEEGDFNVR